jgi:hypothetical protein
MHLLSISSLESIVQIEQKGIGNTITKSLIGHANVSDSSLYQVMEIVATAF